MIMKNSAILGKLVTMETGATFSQFKARQAEFWTVKYGGPIVTLCFHLATLELYSRSMTETAQNAALM